MRIKGRSFFSIFGLLLCSVPAFAGSLLGLKQVQVSNGSQVDLLFDGKLNKGQIRTEFFRDIVQVTLTDASVYPAKISSVNGSVLTKVFAYQYAPKLVRCRLTVKGNAENYKNQVKVVPNGQMLTIRIDTDLADKGVKDRISTSAAKPESVAMDAEERSLLEKVLKGETKAEAEQKAEAEKKADTEKKAAAAPKTVRGKGFKVEKIEKTEDTGAKRLAGGKSMMSPLQVVGRFALLGGLLALLLAGVKRFLKGNNVLSRLAKQSLGKKKMIEVLSTHHLGPKKSIAVVNVAGRMLVLGVTNDSINLIAQLSGDAAESAGGNVELSELEELGLKLTENSKPSPTKSVSGNTAGGVRAAAAEPGLFSEFLNQEAAKPATYSPPSNHSPLKAAPAKTNPSHSVRAQIRNRLEGLKQL